jgi:hypothetical protein
VRQDHGVPLRRKCANLVLKRADPFRRKRGRQRWKLG